MEKKKAMGMLGLSNGRFGQRLPHLFYLSFPDGGVQLFPKEYLKGLKEYCDQNSDNSVPAVRTYTALQEGPSARAFSHIAKAKQEYAVALARVETFTVRELAGLMCVEASRVEIWIECGKLKPEHDSETDTGEARFSKATIDEAFKWHIPPS